MIKLIFTDLDASVLPSTAISGISRNNQYKIQKIIKIKIPQNQNIIQIICEICAICGLKKRYLWLFRYYLNFTPILYKMKP